MVSNCTVSPGAMRSGRGEGVVPAVVDVVPVDGVAGAWGVITGHRLRTRFRS